LSRERSRPCGLIGNSLLAVVALTPATPPTSSILAVCRFPPSLLPLFRVAKNTLSPAANWPLSGAPLRRVRSDGNVGRPFRATPSESVCFSTLSKSISLGRRPSSVHPGTVSPPPATAPFLDARRISGEVITEPFDLQPIFAAGSWRTSRARIPTMLVCSSSL
jgi:hypothetical protein